jgi:hypothetical protein
MADPLRLVMVDTISKETIQSGVKKQWNKNIRSHLALAPLAAAGERDAAGERVGGTAGRRPPKEKHAATTVLAARPCPGLASRTRTWSGRRADDGRRTERQIGDAVVLTSEFWPITTCLRIVYVYT